MPSRTLNTGSKSVHKGFSRMDFADVLLPLPTIILKRKKSYSYHEAINLADSFISEYLKWLSKTSIEGSRTGMGKDIKIKNISTGSVHRIDVGKKYLFDEIIRMIRAALKKESINIILDCTPNPDNDTVTVTVTSPKEREPELSKKERIQNKVKLITAINKMYIKEISRTPYVDF